MKAYIVEFEKSLKKKLDHREPYRLHKFRFYPKYNRKSSENVLFLFLMTYIMLMIL